MNDLLKPKRTRNLIKTNESLKRIFTIMQTVHLTLFIYAVLFSILSGSFNFYFFFLNIFKIIIFAVMCYTMVYILFDDQRTMTKWQEKAERDNIFLGKWFFSLIESSKVFVPSIVLLLILNFTSFKASLENRFIENNPGALSPFSYNPNIIEGILIGTIIILSLLMIFSAPYWSVARFFTINGYIQEKKLVKVKGKQFMFALLFQLLLLIIFTIVLDGMFIEIRHGDIYDHWGIFFTLLEGRAYIILLIQVCLLLILNIIYFLDGWKQMKKRENFVELSKIQVDISY